MKKSILFLGIILNSAFSYSQISIDTDPPNDDIVFLVNNIIDFEFSIYSRWSEQVFHTTDINSHWNGKYNGRLVPTGTYAYTISAYGKDAKIFKKNGYVNVIH